MEEETITLTQAELDAKINEAVETATKDINSKHNADMAKMRKERDEAIKANKSQDQIKQEQDEEVQRELTELRAYKKGKVIEERLAKENLPNYFKNDSRLLNSNEDEFEKALKEVKREYEASLPKGNQTSTVVNTGGKVANKSSAEVANEQMADVLKDLLG